MIKTEREGKRKRLEETERESEGIERDGERKIGRDKERG